MGEATLESVTRQAGGRIVAALAARFRHLDIAEEAFAEACVQAAEAWPAQGMPREPAAWLYLVAEHRALDALRKQRIRDRTAPDPPDPEPSPEDAVVDAAPL